MLLFNEYYDSSTKFIFIATRLEAVKDIVTSYQEFFEFFEGFRIVQLQLIGKFDGKLKAISYNPFKKSIFPVNTNDTNLDVAFSDKMQNFYGYKYGILFAGSSIPRLTLIKGQLFGPDVLFLQVWADKQNVTLERFTIRKWSELELAFTQKTADILLNTHIFHDSQTKKKTSINTFDTDGFCAMVPLPEVRTFFDFAFKPFDFWTWMFILISFMCCIICWRILICKSNVEEKSSFYYGFWFIANFLGQTIPFREHRTSQKIILQITIVITFVLGTLYQSLIVASLTASNEGLKITTIEELIDDDYSFIVDKTFVGQLNGSEYYQRMSSRIVKYLDETDFMNCKNLSSQNIVIIAPCSFIIHFLEQIPKGINQQSVLDFYYKLEEQFNCYYLELLMPYPSFFLNQLQEFSLIVFESGIKKAWAKTNPVTDTQKFMESNISQNADYFLILSDIAPIFYILGGGLAFSTFVFLLEIFWHDFLIKLSFGKSLARIKSSRKLFGIRPFRRNRVIQVAPVNREET